MTPVPLDPALPAGFGAWSPWLQAAVLAALTFVTEDAVTVVAGLLAAAGTLAWTTAFGGTFLGIWLGDAALYVTARLGGRPLLHHAWTRRFWTPTQLDRGERWFAERGAGALVLSRLVPGTRLPTYLAAGLLRMPFRTFAGVTGAAALAWTLLIFVAAATLGTQLLPWVQRGPSAVLALPVTALTLTLVLKARTRTARRTPQLPSLLQRLRAGLARWRRWEFWPAWLFYLPVVVYYVGLALRHRSFTLPTAANPGILHSGLVGESKIATLRDLAATHPDFTAPAWEIPVGDPADRLARFDALVARHALAFPLILKPDLGQRGVGVKKVRHRADAAAVFAAMTAPLLLQVYVPGPHEAGIFYHRPPGARRGRIVGITDKRFPTVTGDGRRTLAELVWSDDRARCLADRYRQRFTDDWDQVLPTGTTLRLVEAGNHAQGCVFRDGSPLWSAALEHRIDAISQALPGFHVGRFDLRYTSVESLRAGLDFKIVELNGAGAEDTRLYDPAHSLFRAYGILFRQWRTVFETGAANRARGVKPTPPLALWRTWRNAARQFAATPPAD